MCTDRPMTRDELLSRIAELQADNERITIQSESRSEQVRVAQAEIRRLQPNWELLKKLEAENARHKRISNTKCVSCGNEDGFSGDTCANCGGMLLSWAARDCAKMSTCIAELRDQLAAMNTEVRCPIGLDDVTVNGISICSAGSCYRCVVNRVGYYRTERDAALAERDGYKEAYESAMELSEHVKDAIETGARKICAYCGLGDARTFGDMSAHMLVCEKHPMRDIAKQLDAALTAINKAYEAIPLRLERGQEWSDAQDYMDSVDECLAILKQALNQGETTEHGD